MLLFGAIIGLKEARLTILLLAYLQFSVRNWTKHIAAPMV